MKKETLQLFLAREAGPELVGTVGGRTAVANNDQIVEGIARGVQDANIQQNALLREQNDLLRAILEKEGTIRIGKERVDAVSAGSFIERDVEVRVVEVEGTRVVVEPVPKRSE